MSCFPLLSRLCTRFKKDELKINAFPTALLAEPSRSLELRGFALRGTATDLLTDLALTCGDDMQHGLEWLAAKVAKRSL